LEQIVLSVKKVSDIVAEIAAASREQSAGIEQVNRAVVQMDELTQQDAALVEQATAASQQLTAQVQGLQELLARYRGDSQAPAPRSVGMTSVAARATIAAKAATAKAATANAAMPVRTERRKANRPWSQPRASVVLHTAVEGTSATLAGAPEDCDWQEF
jgi:methyl-accepting chemotaxis protein I, serine sensor receptor